MPWGISSSKLQLEIVFFLGKLPSVNGTPSQSPDEKQSEIDDKASELATSEPEAKEGTGKYSGQADNNFIEIEIGEKNYNVFQLSEELKEKFEELKLETGDSIQV